MSKEEKPIKIVFAPGCFDNFEGTQEELDKMIAEITQMIESGEIYDKAEMIELDELIEAELDDPDSFIHDMAASVNRKLQ